MLGMTSESITINESPTHIKLKLKKYLFQINTFLVTAHLLTLRVWVRFATQNHFGVEEQAELGFVAEKK